MTFKIERSADGDNRDRILSGRISARLSIRLLNLDVWPFPSKSNRRRERESERDVEREREKEVEGEERERK